MSDFLTINNILGGLDQDFEGGHEIICPVCGNNYQHVESVNFTKGNDNYEAWAGRGDMAVVAFFGECGSVWGIGFGFHKGNSYTQIQVIKSCKIKDNYPDLSPIEISFLEVAVGIISGIEPQYWIGSYRVDFAIPDKKIVIELDGHDYHKTKEQRTGDAKRERFLELEGWRVIRFTGSEVHKSAFDCVMQAVNLIKKWSGE